MKKIYIDKRVTTNGKKSEIENNNSFDLNSHIESVVNSLDLTAEPYKEYIANVTQKTTNDPNPVVLKNTLDGTLVWSRDNIGIYKATLTGAFPDNNKLVILTSPTYSNLNPLNDIALISGGWWNDADNLYFTTATMDNTGARTIADSVMYHTIIIRVYP